MFDSRWHTRLTSGRRPGSFESRGSSPWWRSQSASPCPRPPSSTGFGTFRIRRSSTATARPAPEPGRRAARRIVAKLQGAARRAYRMRLGRVSRGSRSSQPSRLRLHVHRRGLQAEPERGLARETPIPASFGWLIYWIRRLSRNPVTYSVPVPRRPGPSSDLRRFWSFGLGVDPKHDRLPAQVEQRRTFSPDLAEQARRVDGVVPMTRTYARACKPGWIGRRTSG